jgi:protein SCO1/2
MSLSARGRMLLGFVLANTVIIAVAAAVLLNQPKAPPLIQGVLLAEGRAVDSFRLLSHFGEPFSNSDLRGQWHLVSYGFTTCPDVCPTTLSQLAVVASKLEAAEVQDLRFLFYTVDHRRDTATQLASYLPFFHRDFLGLTHLDDPANPHQPFEQGLGIAARLEPVTDGTATPSVNDYQVIHGISLLLLNPRGELQAIFKPNETAPGVRSFDPDKILRDYRAIRNYLG